MNDIDLTKILKDCPKGTKFYTTIWGEVMFSHLSENTTYPICIQTSSFTFSLTKKGYTYIWAEAECVIFPSRQQRDWSKFTAPWYKKERFDPKALKPFDRVICRHCQSRIWHADFFSFCKGDNICTIGIGYYDVVIPYNDDTKHLVGTTDEAPECYRYWED